MEEPKKMQFLSLPFMVRLKSKSIPIDSHSKVPNFSLKNMLTAFYKQGL